VVFNLTETTMVRQRERAVGKRDLGRVLVTGADGFLGAAIISELLARNVDVVASDIGPVASARAGMISCEVTDFDQVEGVVGKGDFKTILHCGAVSGPMVMPDKPLGGMAWGGLLSARPARFTATSPAVSMKRAHR
jgi:NAD(P)-dependent dehydrogenase (short-subunit alcohol dehydrogenase family)